MRDEGAVVRLALAYRHEEAVIVAAELHRGAGQVVREAALLQHGCAEGKIRRGPGDARGVGCRLVLGTCDLDGVDGATDIKAARRCIDGAACGIAVGGGVRLSGTRA